MTENGSLKLLKKKYNRQNLIKLKCSNSEFNCSAKYLSQTALLIFSNSMQSIESGLSCTTKLGILLQYLISATNCAVVKSKIVENPEVKHGT